MAEHEHTLAERLEIQRTRAEALRRAPDAIAAFDASEQSSAPKKKKKKVKKRPKPKPREDIGTGTPSFDLPKALANVDALMALTDDPEQIAKLRARKAALTANAP